MVQASSERSDKAIRRGAREEYVTLDFGIRAVRQCSVLTIRMTGSTCSRFGPLVLDASVSFAGVGMHVVRGEPIGIG
jgi:hypothetical protein